jgi:hypothetical protein
MALTTNEKLIKACSKNNIDNIKLLLKSHVDANCDEIPTSAATQEQPDHKFLLNSGAPFYIQRWPDQTDFDAIISSLFFPKELEENDEIDLLVYQKPYVSYALVLSAKYGNLLASYHLARILENYGPETDEIVFLKESFDDKAKNFLNSYKEKTSLGFQHGILLTYLSDFEGAKECFASNNGDIRSTYRLGMLTEDKRYYESIKDDYPRAYLGLGETAESLNEVFENYYQAGSLGIKDGYHRIGILLEAGYSYNGVNKGVIGKEPQYFFGLGKREDHKYLLGKNEFEDLKHFIDDNI